MNTLHFLFNKTTGIAILYLILFTAIGEYSLRQESIQNFLIAPSYNGRHLHFARQWNRLKQVIESGEKIQCIALGNSMILNGFDPAIFEKNFLNVSGMNINCFNFGIDALTPVSASDLAKIIVKIYHPRLLIFGTDARDFAIDDNSEETSVINEMAWIQYQLGHFSIEGWLLENTYLYRYRQSILTLFELSFQSPESNPFNQYGFEPVDQTFPVTTPPDPMDKSYHVQYYFRVLDNYWVREENQKALSAILALNNTETTVVVVEMPVPKTYFAFFDHPAEDYQEFIKVLEQETAGYKVALLETTPLNLIPDDGWMDYSHVNTKGSGIFSQWLGRRIGNAVSTGEISLSLP